MCANKRKNGVSTQFLWIWSKILRAKTAPYLRLTLQLIDNGLLRMSLDIQEVDARVFAAGDDAHAATERHDGAECRLHTMLRVMYVETLLQSQAALAV